MAPFPLVRRIKLPRVGNGRLKLPDTFVIYWSLDKDDTDQDGGLVHLLGRACWSRPIRPISPWPHADTLGSGRKAFTEFGPCVCRLWLVSRSHAEKTKQKHVTGGVRRNTATLCMWAERQKTRRHSATTIRKICLSGRTG